MGKTAMRFKPLLELKFTLDCIPPRIIQHMGDLNVELGIPNDVIDSLQQQTEEGTKLVDKLSKLSTWNIWWCSFCNCSKPSYTDQLVKLNWSLRTLLKRLELQQAKDVEESLLLMRKINEKQECSMKLYEVCKSLIQTPGQLNQL